METDTSFEQAVRRHDAQVAALGLPLWVGSEPTFTDRLAQTPAWLHAALGDDKEPRARALTATLSRLLPGALLLRSTGRRYPGEAQPRWNLGLLRRRDGEPLWDGPPDPAAGDRTACRRATGHRSLRPHALADAFARQPWDTACTEAAEAEDGAGGAPAWTVTTRCDAAAEPLRFAVRAHTDLARPDGDTDAAMPASIAAADDAAAAAEGDPGAQTPPARRPTHLRRRRPARDHPRRHAARRPALHRTRRAGLWPARTGDRRRQPAGGRHAGAHHRHARPGGD
jgi:hypothetical protein